MSALLAAWAHLTLQRRLHLADVRLAQDGDGCLVVAGRGSKQK